MVGRTPDGIPYLLPLGALLYKAGAAADKDRHDFNTVAALMDADARAWLADALRRLHPTHDWLDALR